MKHTLFRLCAALFLVGISCVAYGRFVEPLQLHTRHVELVSTDYQGPPLRIGLMTDLHVAGTHVPPARVAQLVSRMNVLNPDMVLMPGDFIDGHLHHSETSPEFDLAVSSALAHLSDLTAPAYASLGNHDHMYGAERVTEHLTEAGIQVLDNDAVVMGPVCLVGLADYDMASPTRAAFKDCPEGKPPIVLSHSPQAYLSFRRDTLLAVAGHTHGGQVNLPIIGRRVNAIALGREQSYGFSKLLGVDVFVSAGIGTSILPVRFRSPPEIVLITLRSGS